MNWDFAIDKHRAALKRVLAALVAMAGLTSPLVGEDGSARRGEAEAPAEPGEGCLSDTHPPLGCRPSPPQGGRTAGITLPRHLHRAVLRLLRPAEAAARRLIIIAARNVSVPPPQPRRERPRKPKPKSVFLRNRIGTGIVPGHRPWASTPTPAPRAPAPRSLYLPLADPLRRAPGGRRYRPASRGVPRISVPGWSEPFRPPPPPRPDDEIDATRLVLRLAALARALDDLPAEARRFARWRARNMAAPTEVGGNCDAAGGRDNQEADAAATRGAGTAVTHGAGTTITHGGTAGTHGTGARTRRRRWPLRSGPPPGQLSPRSRRPRHEIHQILDDVHGLAFDALKPPDTS